MPAPYIYIMDDATEQEVWDADSWLWNRNFEYRNPEIFDKNGWRVP